MIKSKKPFAAFLLLLVAAFATVELGTRTHWFENFSEQASQSRTSRYYAENQGGYEGSAAKWTRAAFN